MSMSAELILARILKVAAVAAAALISFALVRAMVGMTCNLKAYSPAVLWAMYASLLMLIVYSKFKFSSRGLVRLPVPLVRRALAAVVALELAGIGILFAWNRDCASIVRALPVPAALLIFYTTVIFSIVFGDAYLGGVRNIIRLGRKPTDFLRDTDRRS